MSDAMTGLATGNRADKPAKREQQIMTPPRIADFVRDVFDGSIALDPCAAVDDFGDVMGFVDAEMYFDGTLAAPLLQCQDGLKQPWVDRTYCNPPFGDLKAWLQKALYEASPVTRYSIAVLCPVRSNRPWWRLARDYAHRTGAYVELNPFPFVGFEKGTMRLTGPKAGTYRGSDESMPVAMCVMFFNVYDATVLAALEASPHDLGSMLAK